MVLYRKCWICLFVMLSVSMAYTEEVLDGIVAIVGDDIILRTELLQKTLEPAMQMGVDPMKQPEKFKEIARDVLKYIIDERVLLAKAEEDTITVEDAQVEASLESRVSELINRFGSVQKVEELFGAPISKLKRDYRDDVQKMLVVQMVRQTKLADVKISRPEVEMFYETMKDSLPVIKPQVHLRHILMTATAGGAARAAANEKIAEIQDQLKQGVSFESLARKYSDDPGTASRGGELGFFERGTLFDNFEDKAFSMDVGQISDVVETPLGLHLIQVIAKEDNRINCRHILISMEVTNEDMESAADTLNELRERILGGESFEDLAKRYSQDTSTRDEGGDLGWNTIDDLQIEAFKKAVDTLEIGEISRPFQTAWGYHIVKLEDRREGRKLTLEDDYEQLADWALSRKQQEILDEWISELKKDIYIHVFEGVL